MGENKVVKQTGSNDMAHKIIECSPFIMQCLGSIEMDCVISEPCYKGTILQRNYRIYNFYVKFNGKKFGSHSMTVL